MHLNTSRAPVSTHRHKLNKNSKWGLSMVVYTFNPKHLGSRGRSIYKVSSRPDKAKQQALLTNKHIKWKITPYDMVWGLYFILLSPWYEKGNQWRNLKKKKRKEITQERERWTGGVTLGWRASNSMNVALTSISWKNKIQPPWSGIIPAVGK